MYHCTQVIYEFVTQWTCQCQYINVVMFFCLLHPDWTRGMKCVTLLIIQSLFLDLEYIIRIKWAQYHILTHIKMVMHFTVSFHQSAHKCNLCRIGGQISSLSIYNHPKWFLTYSMTILFVNFSQGRF